MVDIDEIIRQIYVFVNEKTVRDLQRSQKKMLKELKALTGLILQAAEGRDA